MLLLKKCSFYLGLLILFSCAHENVTRAPRSFDLMNTAFQKYAAEVKALQLQAYHVATDRLNLALKKKYQKPTAVILDIDETVLDNTFYQVQANQMDWMYPQGWEEWVESARATLIPGAKDFISYAQKKGVAVFLITNRTHEEEPATYKNLEMVGLKLKPETVYFRRDKSSKEDRRSEIAKKYEVLLLIGDNLADLDGLFDKREISIRDQVTEKFSEQFGRKFIVLPNAMYGDWELTLYNGKFPATSQEKDQFYKDLLGK